MRVSNEGATRARSRATSGAGGITLAVIAGRERVRSLETVGAGATTPEFSTGAMSTRSRETLGAGGITPPSDMTLRDTSLLRAGTGAITLDGSFGTARSERRPSAGGGPASGRIASKFATAPGDG